MSYTIREFRDIIRALEEHPEWRAELRRLLLPDELLELPSLVRELAEAQRRTEGELRTLIEAHRRAEERLAKLEASVAALTEAHKKAEERLAGLEERTQKLELSVKELAEAQRRTEERLEELAAAQKRTEERLEELAEAQRRTEERLEELAEAQRSLAEAQRRTEEKVEALSIQVGHLANLLGGAVEDDAEDVLRWVMRNKGYRLLDDPAPLDINGEVDLVAPVEDPAGRKLWVLVEAKVRLRRREVLSWARRLEDPAFRARLAAEGIEGPCIPYAYGIRVYPEAVEAAREHGIGLLNIRGERLAPSERRI